MRFLLAAGAVFVILGFLFHFIGSPFDAALTYKLASKINNTEYGGRLRLTGTTYDPRARKYFVGFDDQNGVVSEFVYDPVKNAFYDGYQNDRLSVLFYQSRGEVLKKINARGVFPEEVLLTIDCGAGIIGENSGVKMKCLRIFFENCGREEFIKKTQSLLLALDSFDYESLLIMNRKYSVSFAAGGVSNRREDIDARIKEED